MTSYPRWWKGHDGVGARGLGTITRTAPAPAAEPLVCPEGHLVAGENVHRAPGIRAKRTCRQCFEQRAEAATERRRVRLREKHRAWRAAHPIPPKPDQPAPIRFCRRGHEITGDNVCPVHTAHPTCRQCCEARTAEAQQRAEWRAGSRAARPVGHPRVPPVLALETPNTGRWGLPIRTRPGRAPTAWHYIVGWQPGLEGIAWRTRCSVVVLRVGVTDLADTPAETARCTQCSAALRGGRKERVGA